MKQTIQLANEFAAKLYKELGKKKMKKVIGLNAAETDSGVCHTHDFCDSNMTMNSAFRKVMGRKYDFKSDADHQLFSKAWTAAKKNGFAPMKLPYELKEPVFSVLPAGEYDAVEVHPVAKVGEEKGQAFFETVDDEKDANFHSVYLHNVEGGIYCIADVPTEESAEQLARLFEQILMNGRITVADHPLEGIKD